MSELKEKRETTVTTDSKLYATGKRCTKCNHEIVLNKTTGFFECNCSWDGKYDQSGKRVRKEVPATWEMTEAGRAEILEAHPKQGTRPERDPHDAPMTPEQERQQAEAARVRLAERDRRLAEIPADTEIWD